MRRRDLLAGGLATLLLPRSARPQTSPAARDAHFEDEVSQWMRLASLPGLVLVEIEGAQVRVSPHGTAHAGTGAPVGPETVFEAASLSKPVVAACVLSMRDEGLLELDVPLAAILTDLGADPAVASITPRHVLSHSSGLPNWRNRRDQPLATEFSPGERFRYSGEGYVLLQRAIERITGRSFPREITRRVLGPLEMSSSGFVTTPQIERVRAEGHGSRGNPDTSWNRSLGRKLDQLAAGSGRSFGDLTFDEVACAFPSVEPTRPPLPNFMLPNAAASLLTTGGDYARFVQAVLGVGPTARAISERARREMVRPQVFLPAPLAWGLGWGLDLSSAAPVFWHHGDNGQFQNFVHADTSTSRALLVFTNGSGGQKVYERLLRARLGRDLPAFVWI